MQNDLSNDKIKDSEIFLDLIYNERFDLAIKCLENQIYPLVAQSHAFGQIKPMNRFVPLRFSAEKENHLIKDEYNLIKFQSGKYKWESFVPKGKLVKVYKKVYWDHSYTIHSMNEFFHRDMLVKWILDNLFSSSEFDMAIFSRDTTEETISILKHDKITIYLTDRFPFYLQRIKKAKLSIEKVKHETAINWMLKKIRKVAHLYESEVMALVAEKKKQSGNQWVEKDGIFEIAWEHGVDFSTFKTVGESGLIVGEASIKDIIEKIDFASVPLSELYSIFESEFYDREEKTKLFDIIVNKVDLSKNFEDLSDLTVRCFFEDKSYDMEDKIKLFESIVEKADISKNFVSLLDLIIHFEDEYYYDEYWDYRFEVLEDFYENVLKNHPEVIMERFPEVLDVINNSRLSDSYFRIYTFSNVVDRIKNTDIMKKHFSLIEDEFKKLLDFFYDLPHWLGKEAPSRWELFSNLPEIVKGTELLRKDVPNFSKLVNFYPSFEIHGDHYVKYFEFYNERGKFYGIFSIPIEEFEASFLLSLYSLIDDIYYYDNDPRDHHEHDDRYGMVEVQYLLLIKIFDILLDKFDEIQKDEEAFNLFSKFFKALKHKKLALTEKTLTNKIAQFTTNLSIIKERYPEMWEEYERNKRDSLK